MALTKEQKAQKAKDKRAAKKSANAGTSSKVRIDGEGRVQVEFLRDFVASRGNQISGREGSLKWFPDTNDLRNLTKDSDGEGPVLKIVKKGKSGGASDRETATE